MAALAGVKVAVRLHIRRADDVNAIDENGCTPLMLAASRGHLDVCRLLLDAGASPLIQDIDGNNALTIAINAGSFEVIELLKERIIEYRQQNAESTSDFSFILEKNQLEEAETQESEEIDISEWQEVGATPVPLSDSKCRTLALSQQSCISDHIPEISDIDWADVYIDLPKTLDSCELGRVLEYPKTISKQLKLNPAPNKSAAKRIKAPTTQTKMSSSLVSKEMIAPLFSEVLRFSEESKLKLEESIRLAKEASRPNKPELSSRKAESIKQTTPSTKTLMTRSFLPKERVQTGIAEGQNMSELSKLKLEVSIRLAKEVSKLYGPEKI